jgi:pyridoxal phosphate enzyme (YggS family)
METLPLDAGAVGRRLAQVHERIADAGGDPAEITVVAVTKGFGSEAADVALAVGLEHLGENYAQELLGKATALAADPRPHWHFIGRLQRNKVRLVAPFVTLWQSVDRLSLAREISERAPGAPILVQVALTDDPGRGGCPPGFVPAVVDGARDLGLEVAGLMAVAPLGSPDDARAGFRRVRTLADGLGLRQRSMGMTGDLEAAVAEGTTMVRIGVGLFGERPPSRP